MKYYKLAFSVLSILVIVLLAAVSHLEKKIDAIEDNVDNQAAVINASTCTMALAHTTDPLIGKEMREYARNNC